MPGRKYPAAGGLYRYGFNGKEKSDEVYGEGNVYDYGFRIYNPRLGKFLSVDPLQKKYPELTPYQFSHNAPIDGVDLDGRERYDMRLIKNEDGSTKLQTISIGPKSERRATSLWLKITQIPPYIRLEYNGQHYIFTDGRNHGKMFDEVFNVQVNYMKDFSEFVANPNPDAYQSQEEAHDAFISELAGRTAIGLVGEASNRSMYTVSNRIQWRGRYTNKSTDQQQASVNGGINTKSQGALVKPPTVQVDGIETNVHRGGGSFVMGDKDIRIDPQTGLVKTTHGISLYSDPDKASKFGGAFKIVSLPNELQIIQRGKDKTHFEIVPKQQMSKEDFQKHLNQIKTEKVNTTSNATNGG